MKRLVEFKLTLNEASRVAEVLKHMAIHTYDGTGEYNRELNLIMNHINKVRENYIKLRTKRESLRKKTALAKKRLAAARKRRVKK